MAAKPPAYVGMKVEEVDTPALILDLNAFEANLDLMAKLTGEAGMALRPHAKSHKSTTIANMQIARGAVGQCCQKVGEAEILVDGGVKDVLVSNQIVGTRKLDRLAALARRAKISVLVDDADNVAEIDAAAARMGSRLDVLVELDVGGGRCGVKDAKAVADLAGNIISKANLNFGGLQAYHGSAQHIRGHGERRGAILKAGEMVKDAKAALDDENIPCPKVTGAGTGSFQFESKTGLWDEVQCGSYAFMDADYGRNLDEAGEEVSTFKHSLFILATVMSRTVPSYAVVDAGHKVASVDSGPPTVFDIEDAVYTGPSDEHGKLMLGPKAPKLSLGDKVRLVPGHCDPTVNLHDWYVGVRGGVVESVFPVSARGAHF